MQAPAPTVESSLPPELLQTCVITPEIAAKADYTGIKAGCGAALPAKCTACPCALLASLGGTLTSLGYDVDFSKVSSADASAALALCQDTLLGALTSHGVSLDSILELTQCPDVASFSLSQCPAPK
ncbi:hypothetical protein ABPG77_004116 [Micractinium sp. CCAP 211/92]